MQIKTILSSLITFLVGVFTAPALAQHCNCFEGLCAVVKQSSPEERIELVKDFGKVDTFDRFAPEVGHNIPNLFNLCAKRVERLLQREGQNPTPEQLQLFSPPNFITVVNVEDFEGGSLLQVATRENSCRQKCK